MPPTDDLAHRFQFHPATTDRAKALHEATRNQAQTFAEWADEVLPDCREKSVVMTKIEEAMFWANAAIAREISGRGVDYPGDVQVVKD